MEWQTGCYICQPFSLDLFWILPISHILDYGRTHLDDAPIGLYKVNAVRCWRPAHLLAQSIIWPIVIVHIRRQFREVTLIDSVAAKRCLHSITIPHIRFCCLVHLHVLEGILEKLHANINMVMVIFNHHNWGSEPSSRAYTQMRIGPETALMLRVCSRYNTLD